MYTIFVFQFRAHLLLRHTNLYVSADASEILLSMNGADTASKVIFALHEESFRKYN